MKKYLKNIDLKKPKQMTYIFAGIIVVGFILMYVIKIMIYIAMIGLVAYGLYYLMQKKKKQT